MLLSNSGHSPGVYVTDQSYLHDGIIDGLMCVHTLYIFDICAMCLCDTKIPIKLTSYRL